MKRKIAWSAIILLPVLLIGGILLLRRDVTRRNIEFPTQMARSPAYLSQTSNPVLPGGMTGQKPVDRTIARGGAPFHYGPGPEEIIRAGVELHNPLAASPENLKRGENVYANYCLVCHGPTGGGDGPIVPKYPNPPSFQSAPSIALADGSLYHVITMGRGNMPSHAGLIARDDRWKVILHIRKMQGKVQ